MNKPKPIPVVAYDPGLPSVCGYGGATGQGCGLTCLHAIWTFLDILLINYNQEGVFHNSQHQSEMPVYLIDGLDV